MITVMGATGNIGKRLIPHLQKSQKKYKALVRNRERGTSLLGHEVPLSIANYRDEKSMKQAFKGTTRLLLLTDQIPDQWQIHKSIIDWARSCGVQHIVKISAGKYLTREDSPSLACRSHWQADQYLKTSSLNYTIIYPQAFMDTCIESALPQIVKGKLVSPFNHQSFSFVAAEDIAAMAYAALNSEQHLNKCYVASGPEPITWPQLAKLLSKHLNRPIRFVKTPLWLTKTILKLTVKPKSLGVHKSQMISELHRSNHTADLSRDQEEMTGTKPMSFDEFLKKNIGSYQTESI